MPVIFKMNGISNEGRQEGVKYSDDRDKKVDISSERDRVFGDRELVFYFSKG